MSSCKKIQVSIHTWYKVSYMMMYGFVQFLAFWNWWISLLPRTLFHDINLLVVGVDTFWKYLTNSPTRSTSWSNSSTLKVELASMRNTKSAFKLASGWKKKKELSGKKLSSTFWHIREKHGYSFLTWKFWNLIEPLCFQWNWKSK